MPRLLPLHAWHFPPPPNVINHAGSWLASAQGSALSAPLRPPQGWDPDLACLAVVHKNEWIIRGIVTEEQPAGPSASSASSQGAASSASAPAVAFRPVDAFLVS